jgi:hypothetical protein
LDESESLKTSKDECDETVPEWVNAEFSGELQFENGQEKKQPITNIESDNSYKSPKLVESVRGEVDETALVTICIRQEAMLAREDSGRDHDEEWTYWLIDSNSTTHIDLTTEGMIDIIKMEKGEDQA